MIHTHCTGKTAVSSTKSFGTAVGFRKTFQQRWHTQCPYFSSVYVYKCCISAGIYVRQRAFPNHELCSLFINYSLFLIETFEDKNRFWAFFESKGERLLGFLRIGFQRCYRRFSPILCDLRIFDIKRKCVCVCVVGLSPVRQQDTNDGVNDEKIHAQLPNNQRKTSERKTLNDEINRLRIIFEKFPIETHSPQKVRGGDSKQDMASSR